jgi:hypothetical protein
MYLHVPKVGPLIRDRHLVRHDHLGNALSKRVDLRGRLLFPRQMTLSAVETDKLIY